VADSLMTYRRRYFAFPQWPGVLDLLLTDESNPRSLCFQIAALAAHAAKLPHEIEVVDGGLPPARQFSELLNLLQTNRNTVPLGVEGTARRDLEQLLQTSGERLRQASESITHLYFSHSVTHVS